MVVTKKIDKPLSVRGARDIIKYMGRVKVQDIDVLIVERALDTLEQYKISYWDSLIIAAADRAQCNRILSEDETFEKHPLWPNSGVRLKF